jgi:hypothetical protein
VTLDPHSRSSSSDGRYRLPLTQTPSVFDVLVVSPRVTYNRGTLDFGFSFACPQSPRCPPRFVDSLPLPFSPPKSDPSQRITPKSPCTATYSPPYPSSTPLSSILSTARLSNLLRDLLIESRSLQPAQPRLPPPVWSHPNRRRPVDFRTRLMTSGTCAYCEPIHSL